MTYHEHFLIYNADIEQKHRQSSECKEVTQPKSAKSNKEETNINTSDVSDTASSVPNTNNSALELNVLSHQSAEENNESDMCNIKTELCSHDGAADDMKPSVDISVIKSNFEKVSQTHNYPKSPQCGRKFECAGDISYADEESDRKSERKEELVAVSVEEKENQNVQVDDTEMSLSVSERKENYESLSNQQSPESPELRKRTSSGGSRKRADKDRKSNMDAQTLALIREIGSAILNSPAKSQIETLEEEDQGGEFSLVRHFVRDIEKRTQKDRKPAREIIIIDKETQERKKRGWRFRSQETNTQQCGLKSDGNSDSEISKCTTMSPSDERQTPKTEEIGTTDKCQSSSAIRDKASDASSEHSDAQNQSGLVSNLFNVKGNIVDSANIELDENHIDKVRNLVGKFEISDAKQSVAVSPSVSECLMASTAEKSSTQSIQSSTGSPVDNQTVVNSPIDIPKVQSASVCRSPAGSSDESKESSSAIGDKDMCFDNASGSLTSKEVSEMSSLPIVHDPSTEILPEESVRLLQLRKNLRKTSLPYGQSSRPKSADMLRRSNTSPGYSMYTLRHSRGQSDTPQTFTWEGKKIRKMHGKSHPLTKLEHRRNNPFYNTM